MHVKCNRTNKEQTAVEERNETLAMHSAIFLTVELQLLKNILTS